MIAADAPEALERFHSALDIVDRIANQTLRSLGPNIEKDELLAFGREGLLDAARRFEEARKVPFRAYATYRVRGAIYDGIRQSARLSRKTHEKLSALEAARQTSEGAANTGFLSLAESDATVEAAFDEQLASLATAVSLRFAAETARGDEGKELVATEPNAEEAYANAELVSLVLAAVDGLNEEEREIVRRYYMDDERMDTIAASLSIQKSWASRIHTRAIARLTKRLRGAAG